MTLYILTSALFGQTLITGFCFALNVTVSPSPWTFHPVGGNVSIWCSVSQKRKRDSLLTVRWVFSPWPGNEQTIGRITKYGNVHISGNWSQKGELSNESTGNTFSLKLTKLNPSDQGHYTCRVQEVAQNRNRWSAVSNGSASTQLKVTNFTKPEEKQLLSWTLFQDLYLYAVLLCCVGILSLLTFFLILLCQTILKKQRSKVKWKHSFERYCDKDSYPSVTDLMSLAPHKKKKQKKKREEELPPIIPVKGPLISLEKGSQKPLLLPRLAEEKLAYAELELINLKPAVKDFTTNTVYAQILFEENILKQNTDTEGQATGIVNTADMYIK
ncbi:V-set and transmembrane domain-containing protein 4 [Hyperolius riggenbachi]|uniref:V-set and transmembrane domain-containing protein 4 n=1 Tax=Hyperolius riggenbachi TaxID=752182 RepID=UPI0035A3505B